METAFEADYAVALRLAGSAEVFSDDLDAEFPRLGARILQEYRVGERHIRQPLRQPLQASRLVQVGGGPKPARLVGQRLGDRGMGVAKCGDGRPGDKVKVAPAMLIEKVASLAPLEIDIGPRIDGHQGGHGEFWLNLAR